MTANLQPVHPRGVRYSVVVNIAPRVELFDVFGDGMVVLNQSRNVQRVWGVFDTLEKAANAAAHAILAGALEVVFHDPGQLDQTMYYGIEATGEIELPQPPE